MLFLQAKAALTNLRNSVDTLITIPNDLLLGCEYIRHIHALAEQATASN